MTFEMYKQTWKDAYAYTNLKISNVEKEIEELESNSIDLGLKLISFDMDYAEKIRQLEHKRKKRSRINKGLLIGCFILILLYVLLLILKAELILAALMALLTPVLGVGPFLVVGIIILNIIQIKRIDSKLSGNTEENKEKDKLKVEASMNEYNQLSKNKKQEKAVLLAKRDEIEKHYFDIVKVLIKIYNAGNIHKSYHGLIPMATIYGYLDKGVCTIIRGHGGVYERYEDDLKHQRIVGLLTEISSKLDMVIKNQKALYDLVEAMNDTLSNIKSEIDQATASLEKMESNSYIQTTAAVQTAETNKYLAYCAWQNN